MRKSSHSWTQICAFWGMLIAAFSYLFDGLFNCLIKWIDNISYDLAHTLSTIASICKLLGSIALLVAIAAPAWEFVKYKRKVWKVFYWIALVVYILGVTFGLIWAF